MMQLLEKIWDKVLLWLLTSGLRILVMVLVLWIFLHFVKMIGRHILKLVEDDDPTTRNDREKRADTLVGIMNTTAKILAVMVLLYMMLRELNVDVAPLLAGAGIAGIAIGFGAQSLVKDVISGFFILSENQFRLGDFVRVGGVSGMVEEINLRTTILRDTDGTKHVVPNSSITTVSNLTFSWARAVIDVGVSYGADLDVAMKIMGEVGTALKADPVFGLKIIEEPKVLGVETFADSAIILRIIIKTQPQTQWEVAREYRRRLKTAFDTAGIAIPYPQMVVHQAGKNT
jgi:moderate conductance mechanosensitive channel